MQNYGNLSQPHRSQITTGVLMGKLKLLLLTFLGGCVLLLPLSETFSQTVKIKREAMSPGKLGTYTGFPISTGLRTVPIGMKVYLNADTTGAVTTFSWSFVSTPGGSAAFSDPAAKNPTFVPDLAGQYIVRVEIDGGKEAFDTLFASTYAGLAQTGLSCGTCHSAFKTNWEKTNHATMYQRGITGQLEAEEHNGKYVGQYGSSCIKCHTTGWEPNVDNGNFGFESKKVGFDTTWYTGLDVISAGRFYVPFKDMTRWNQLTTSHTDAAKTAMIGCESCHGPGKDHMTTVDKTKISKSLDAGVCNQCHDAPNKHRLGSYWQASNHATMPLSGSRAGSTGCWPCHNGDAFVAFTNNQTTPDYSKVQVFASISCATCHDPHGGDNPNQLRTVTSNPLINGYSEPGVGGKGNLCMNCHRSRYDGPAKVAAQARVFADRFYAHYSPQADMYMGTNAYDYGLPINGIGTHKGLKDGCVTCHMAERVNGSSVHSNHEMFMKDETGKDIVTACKECHGESVEEFSDIKAFEDYDGDGTIEGVQYEVKGLLEKLKAILPKNASGEPVNMRVDSMLVKNDPNWPRNLAAIWNYYFVKYDFSYGIHNTKYTIALLKASIGSLTGIEPIANELPSTFTLSQNYPNPFNPSTQITLGIPEGKNIHLGVYDETGKEIAVLVSGYYPPGTYRVTWDATGTPSGVYFYRLTSGSYSTTRKMMLVK